MVLPHPAIVHFLNPMTPSINLICLYSHDNSKLILRDQLTNKIGQYGWCYFGLFFDIPSPWETFSNHPFNKMYLGTNWPDTLCDSQVLIWKYQQQKTFPEWNMIQRTLFGKTDMSPGVRDFTKRFWSIPQTNIVFNCKKNEMNSWLWPSVTWQYIDQE